MNKIFNVALAAAAITLGANVAQAQSEVATQDVSFEVQAINSLSVTGSPSLVIIAASAGSAPTSVSANASYAITTNEIGRKITASLDVAMLSGLTLKAQFGAPSGANASEQVLSTAAADVVTGISTLSQEGLNIQYTLEATALAGVVAPASRTVTYTIVAGA